MHEFTPEVEALAKEILDYSLIRLRTDPPLDGPKTAQELYELAGNTITAKGLGGQLYWYAVLPLHTFVFPTMIRNLIRSANRKDYAARNA